MTQPRYKGLFPIAIVCVLMYAFFFSTTIVFADEPAPPANTEEAIDLSTDENLTDPSPEIEEDQGDGQAEASDAGTTAPASSQDEQVNPAEGPDAKEALSEGEAGTLPEQELPNDDPVETSDQTLAVDESAPVALEQLPTDTTVVVVIDDQIEPLATQEAASALELGDPMWCPAGSKPGDPGCSASYTSLASLLADLRAQNGGTGVAQDGTIWIEDSYVSSVNDPTAVVFTLNGTTLTSWANHALTLQGGWNGLTNSTGTLSGVSDFFVPVRILNWNNTVSINNINVSTSTANGITVTTSGTSASGDVGAINLDNVTSNNSTGHGALLSNHSAGSNNGNITVTASIFNGNSSNGLVANSNGTITLHNVTANTNGSNGASLNDSNGTGAIALTGTNVFNGNTLSGLRAVSTSAITSVTSLTANNNGSYGALLNNSSGTGNVMLSGTNGFSSNTLDGLRVISTGNITSSGSLTADSNSQYGVFLNNSSGTGYISLAGTITLNNSSWDGLRALSNANIDISANLTANNNRYGVFLNNSTGAGNIAFTGTNTFSGNTNDGLRVLSAGNITSTTSLTANDNDRYGVYLDNTAGSGSISLVGINTFSSNDLSGLNVLSNGVISLANLTANNNGSSGNPGFRYGAYVDNCTGTAGVTLSGSNDFSGNYSTGLVILTNGAIVANSLTASDNGNTGNSNPNYGYGAYLDNSTGAASVKLTGASVFNSNYSSGLLVNSQKDVTLNSITAGADVTAGNGGHGVLILSGSTVSLTGTNHMIGNLFSGVHVTAVGDINIYNPTANANGQHGFYVETTNGNTSLRCGYGEDNGLYGVNAAQNKALYLFSMNFNGNALGSVNLDGGDVYTYPGGCGADPNKHSLGDQKLSLHTLFVSGAQERITLDCRLYSGTQLILPNGDSALIPCPSAESASLQSLSKANLPGELPDGWVYGSGFALELGDTLGGQVSLAFVIPDGMSVDTLAILFWNGSQWVEVAGARINAGRFEAQVDYTGIFVLVGK